MKPILTLLIAAALTLSANAAEKIEGAFGFKLGDVLDFADARLVKEDAHRRGPDSYEFKPTTSNPAFANYFVDVTPNSHRIYMITAWGSIPAPKPNTDDEWNQFQTILALVHRKYGSGPYPYKRFKEISQDQRKITYQLSYTSSLNFELHYFDQDISTQASEEMVDNRLKGADATGL